MFGTSFSNLHTADVSEIKCTRKFNRGAHPELLLIGIPQLVPPINVKSFYWIERSQPKTMFHLVLAVVRCLLAMVPGFTMLEWGDPSCGFKWYDWKRRNGCVLMVSFLHRVRVCRHWRTRSETICRAWILAMPFFLFLCKTFMPSLKRQRYTRAPQVKRVFYNEHAS